MNVDRAIYDKQKESVFVRLFRVIRVHFMYFDTLLVHGGANKSMVRRSGYQPDDTNPLDRLVRSLSRW